MILYNCCTNGDEDGSYVITKFDDLMDVEASYTTSLETCECPAGVRDTCRHRKMLPIFIASGHIDDNWFYNYDTHGWHKIGQEDIFVDQDVEPAPEPAPKPTLVPAGLSAPATSGTTTLRRRI